MNSICVKVITQNSEIRHMNILPLIFRYIFFKEKDSGICKGHMTFSVNVTFYNLIQAKFYVKK